MVYISRDFQAIKKCRRIVPYLAGILVCALFFRPNRAL